MNGVIDRYGRALVRVKLKHPTLESELEIDAWVDTGFTGTLLLLPSQVAALRLPVVDGAIVLLAGGQEASLQATACRVSWFGAELRLETVIGGGQCALLGVGLLEHLTLHLDYPARTVTLEMP